MKTVFVVDDSDTTLTMVERALEGYYRVMTLPSASKMFMLLEKVIPDLILLDIEMPEMDGLSALRKLKANNLFSHIPVMFLTGRTDPAIEVSGFELGAVDFVTKPFSAPVLLNRIRSHLDIEDIIHERTLQLVQLQDSVVSVLANMVENRDKETGDHIERTSMYIRILIDGMKVNGLYFDELNSWDVEKIIISARMHDLGKISISDSIINKPGKLTIEEFEIMKSHTTIGEKIIDEIIAQNGEVDFLNYAKLFAGFHHERWDGKGYPRGVKELDIPLQGRIMAIADVYDALVSERPYKKPFLHDEAVKIIMESTGMQYDPKIAEVFFELKDKFAEIAMGKN
ncbi:MAG: response regulator [Spirochaetes bacterium]|nr:response regulator [Brevinematales bacterium]MCL1960074.1 response regulator [Spirochaetota bacterium]